MFIPNHSSSEVKSDGSLSAKICMIGEAPGADEVRTGKPFTGAAGRVLQQCMHTAGLIRSDCYITNVVKEKPIKNNIGPYFHDKKGFTERGREWRDKLLQELENVKSNVFVTLGSVATHALIGRGDVTKVRGYIFEGTLPSGRAIKVIPVIHPAAALRGQYIFRHYIAHDLFKAKNQSLFPEIRWPDIKLMYNMGFQETLNFLDGLCESNDPISFDIEVSQFEVSCISFTDKKTYAVSIPIDDRWTELEEVLIWRAISNVLENPQVEKEGQNLIFDMQFLAIKMGIQVSNYSHNPSLSKGTCLIRDTMIGHSLIYPDFQKSLGFLASIYTDVPYWKDMVRFKGGNIKKES